MSLFPRAFAAWCGAMFWTAVVLFSGIFGGSRVQAQFAVAPASLSLDVALGSTPAPVTFTVTNPLTVAQGLTVTTSNTSAFILPTDIFGVPESGSVLYTVSFDFSDFSPGFYEANLQFYQIPTARPGRNTGAVTTIPISINVYIDGPPSVPSLYYEASPFEVTPEGIVLLEGSYFGLGAFESTGRPPFTYEWSFSNDGEGYTTLPLPPGAPGFSSYYDITAVTPSDAGYYRFTVSNDLGTTSSMPFRMEVYSPPAIQGEPSDIEAAEGLSAFLQFDVSGSQPMAYKWYMKPSQKEPGVPLTDGPLYTGTESATLEFPSADAPIAGDYYCTATNLADTVTSRIATVSVLSAPIITDQPQTIEVFDGEDAAFHVAALSSLTLSYTWQYSASGASWADVVNSASIDGQGTPSLYISPATTARAGQYRCIVANSVEPVTSDVAELIVSPQPARLQLSPESIDHYVVTGAAFPSAQLTITNVGVAPLSFSFAPPSETFLGAANPASGSVLVGTPRVISIPFPNSALAAGVYETDLILSTNAFNAGSTTIPVRLTVVAPFTVTTLNDSGTRSLREIITLANSTAGAQTIRFAVEGDIVLDSALPALTDPAGTTIDGGLKVGIDGRNLLGRQNGLELRSANNLLTGLTIINFPANGVLVTGAAATGNRIILCNIGTDKEEDFGNREAGIRLDGGSSGTTIGGLSEQANVISGNAFSAITIGTSNNNIIGGNTMGPRIDKPGFVGNGGHGIHLLQVFTGDVTIGGTAFFASNVIAGNKFFPESVDVLAGRTVELTALTAGTDVNSFEWFRGTVSVGSTNKLILTNVQNANEGLYSCVITNPAGTATSKQTYLNVLSPAEFLAKELLPKFIALDTNGDGFLSYTELAAAAREALTLASGGRTRNMTQAEFDQLDANDDGFVSVEEMLNGSSLEVEDVRYALTPESKDFADANIDAGATAEEVFYIDNLDTTALDMITTPTLTGLGAADYTVTADSGPNVLGALEFREMKITFNPSAQNQRAAYLEIRTDDFTLPYFPLPLVGTGFLPTPDLIQSLLKTGGPNRPVTEVDVNEDGVLDAADISTNTTNNH